jgi:hypothetical protein
MTMKELAEWVDRDEFLAGYLIATANIMHLHDSPVIAADVLGEVGTTRAAMRKLGLCDYDRKALNAIFRELERRSAYRRARASQEPTQ